MSIRTKCPKAQRDHNRMLICRVTGQLCAHQRWCLMDGMSILTNEAEQCTGRDAEDGSALFAAAEKTGEAAEMIRNAPAEDGAENDQDKPTEAGTENVQDKPAEDGTENVQEKPAEDGTENDQDKPAEDGTENIQDKPAEAGEKSSRAKGAETGAKSTRKKKTGKG